MKSVLYRPTGKFTSQGVRPSLKNREIVRNNEIFAPDFLSPYDLHRKSIYVGGDMESGADLRLNAVGDTPDSSTGYQIVTDTLTFIKQQISEQVFYKIAPADYMPVVVGEGSMAANLLFNRSYVNAEDFEAGNIRTGVGESRLSSADASVDGLTTPIMNWAKSISYTLFEVEQALRANTWDPIMAKQAARKENWDLGIQRTAFLGLKTDARFPGLLNQPSVNTNTSLITGYIKNMNAAALQTFVAGLISAYFVNTNSTRVPNRFVIPTVDYLGLTQLTTGTVGTYPYPLIKYLEDAFKAAVAGFGETDFRIMPCAYCDAANNTSYGINHNLYALYRADPKTLQMNIPTTYTSTQSNSLNNFSFENVGMGQYTGVTLLRNLELLMFQF